MNRIHGGSFVIVRFGRKGEQIAQFIGYTVRRKCAVRKWRANSRKWTFPVTVEESEVLRYASEVEMRKVPNPPTPGEEARERKRRVMARIDQRFAMLKDV